jgi:hypothetical protein
MHFSWKKKSSLQFLNISVILTHCFGHITPPAGYGERSEHPRHNFLTKPACLYGSIKYRDNNVLVVEEERMKIREQNVPGDSLKQF